MGLTLYKPPITDHFFLNGPNSKSSELYINGKVSIQKSKVISWKAIVCMGGEHKCLL